MRTSCECSRNRPTAFCSPCRVSIPATGKAVAGDYTNVGTAHGFTVGPTPAEITETDQSYYFGADPSVDIAKNIVCPDDGDTFAADDPTKPVPVIMIGFGLFASVRVLFFSAAFPFFNNVDERRHFDLV